MDSIGGFWRRLVVLVRGSRFDEDLDEEMRCHLELQVDAFRAEGLSESAAREAAARKFGSALRAREDSREAWGWAWLDARWRDVRLALRGMRRSPAFTLVAVLTLAIGTGASTAIFSVTDALLLRPLPVDRPGELRFLTHATPRGDIARYSFPAFLELNSRSSFAGTLAAMHNPGPGLMALPDGSPESIAREWATPSYFALLGVRPLAGRLYTTEEERAAARVILIGEGLWQRLFERRPDAIGRTLVENGRPYTIVGILPGEFRGIAPDRLPEVWFPASRCTPRCFKDAGCETFKILARVPPGRSEEAMTRELGAAYRQHRLAVADVLSRTNAAASGERELRLVYAGAGESFLGRQYRRPLTMLLVLVGILLVLMCANIGNLLLARTRSRSRELGTRLALGAGRSSLVAQVLTECLLLALAGAALGTWLAGVLSRSLVATVDAPIDVSPDLRVLVFALAVSLLAALLFGLAPAMGVLQTRVATLLRQPLQERRLRSRLQLGSPLIVLQVTLSVVLLSAAGLFLRSFGALASESPGFGRENVLVFSTVTPKGFHPSADPAIWRLLDRLRQLPGVTSASIASPAPPGGGPLYRASIPGTDVGQPGSEVAVTDVADGFFETLRIPLRRGRLLEESDRGTTRSVSVVNEAFVRQVFGERDPVGQEVELTMAGADGAPGMGRTRIVGVVQDARLRHPREATIPTVFPVVPSVWASRFVVRTAGDPEALRRMLPTWVPEVEPGLRVVTAATIETETGKLLAQERLLAQLSSLFGLVALILAALGVYGVIAYRVAGRTRELGVRMALGATPGLVRSLVLRQTLVLVALGLALGVPAAIWAGRLAASLLYGVAPSDVLTLGAAVTVLAVTALGAGVIPAQRATRIPPLDAVRCE